jgi:nitrilase
MPMSDHLTVAIAQIAPVWLDREATLARVIDRIAGAAAAGAQLVAFGEALVPGYPFWTERTDAARFDDPVQKDLVAHYHDQAVQIEAGHLAGVCAAAADHAITVVLGVVERPRQRGGHSVYCSLVVIAADGTVAGVHRKLVPTWDERLVWAPGDGHGLRTHPLGRFTFGALNCWENWMPLPRAALQADGEDLHVAIWPGGEHLTGQITRFLALEGRSYVLSASGVMHADRVPDGVPHRERILAGGGGWWARGGSCLAAPDGSWVIPPVNEREDLLLAELDHAAVRRARHNFDPAGHYSRPDVTRLVVDRTRQATVRWQEHGGDDPEADPAADPPSDPPRPR